jgi:hypothetical protein
MHRPAFLPGDTSCRGRVACFFPEISGGML